MGELLNPGGKLRDAPDLRVRVLRRFGAPGPWTWQPHAGEAAFPLHRSTARFRSAEEAWAAGRAALLSRAARGGPAPDG